MFGNRKKLKKVMMVFAIIFILGMLAFTLLPLIVARQLNPSRSFQSVPTHGQQLDVVTPSFETSPEVEPAPLPSPF